jgi:hypothetical protein
MPRVKLALSEIEAFQVPSVKCQVSGWDILLEMMLILEKKNDVITQIVQHSANDLIAPRVGFPEFEMNFQYSNSIKGTKIGAWTHRKPPC